MLGVQLNHGGYFAFLFNCTPAGRTSGFMMVPTKRLIYWWNGRGLMYWLFVRPTDVYLLDLFCSVILFYLLLSPYLCFIYFFVSWFICSRRWCIDTLGVFHANQTYIQAKKETPHIKHAFYMGCLHQSLANDSSKFERWFLDYEFLGLC